MKIKNRKNEMDPELKRLIEGLTPNQIRLMASIFAGKARELRKKNADESLSKWKDRDAYGWN